MKKFLGSLLATSMLAVLSGCAGVQNIPLAPAEAEALRGREITVALREQPDFMAMTASRAAFGGALAMTVGGRNVVTNNNIQEPAELVARTIAEALSARYQSRPGQNTVRFDSDDAATRANPSADVLVEVRTLSWGYVYYPTQWNRYRVIYHGRLRLIDAKKGRVIAEGMCSRVPDDAQNAPNGDELLANGAQYIKNELTAAADVCVQHFRTATFALGPGPSLVASAPATPAPAAPSAALAAITPTPPVAAAAPATIASAPSGPLPQVGDSWTYRFAELQRNGRVRRYDVKVADASEGKIVEHYSTGGQRTGEWSHAPGAYLVGIEASVFSPYLAAFQQDLAKRAAIDPVQVADPKCGARFVCEASARVLGSETLTVPAGNFETIKVRVNQSWHRMGGRREVQGVREITVWYAAAAKRVVKVSSRHTSGTGMGGSDADYDLELMSYQLK